MNSKPFRTMLCLLVFVSVCNAQTLPIENAPPALSNSALTPDEIREGILRIEEGTLAKKEVDLLNKTMTDSQALTERERAIAQRELDTEKQRTSLAEEKATVEKTRGDFFQSAFETVTKGTSFGCKIARIFTLGLAKCGRP